jgi:sugar O-acyltransferase (sialic acid O-acetyltransferase NeuD family)
MSGSRPGLIIAGSRDLALQIAVHAATWGGFTVAGFLDDQRPAGEDVGPAKILGGTHDVATVCRDQKPSFLVGVGYRNMAGRAAVYRRLVASMTPATLIHPSVVRGPMADVGPGSIVLGACALDLRARIGANVFVNPACSLSHDSVVEDHCFLAPGVVIAGRVRIEEGVLLGIRTVVSDGIRIASGVRTGAGAVVVHDLDTPGLYVGTPARRIRD